MQDTTALGAGDQATFIARYADLFEHSPWVASRAWRPEGFDSPAAMLDTMMAVVAAASESEQTSLLCAHPELAGREAQAGELTQDSALEQAGAGLNRLEPREFEEMRRLNALYLARHGFPFIVCVRHYTKRGILAELDRRSRRVTSLEREEAFAQIGFIARARLEPRLE
ncbi:2-oxo-4-hydroxy-4-carboxy-5-ureidoimidazoline decarboxylase [Ancylobacter sp. Lp-2]|uniref:2-oxo-4-hydroxy-4-carboxy-5-ureidoimidazoline decarboxylase n=1 Tax=Ancylobacter sp. Lp-2 TaxID=2881339 RepID=UPI001E322439|nr:2-oxo-4-hydroxy-4-carboxy-5-ureidoimidazoline decarboxylase [Ancylobacter sp. Lp-2]MCB4771462.1 2-oxo-4-hydroxy-4-carboxy-5-ureidoimidazoline decarboxylase [Ancylobacter sp. Lp-2]